jgi:hypothetical protein
MHGRGQENAPPIEDRGSEDRGSEDDWPIGLPLGIDNLAGRRALIEFFGAAQQRKRKLRDLDAPNLMAR